MKESLIPFYLKVTRMLGGEIVDTEPVGDKNESVIIHYKDGSAVKMTVETVMGPGGSEELH